MATAPSDSNPSNALVHHHGQPRPSTFPFLASYYTDVCTHSTTLVSVSPLNASPSLSLFLCIRTRHHRASLLFLPGPAAMPYACSHIQCDSHASSSPSDSLLHHSSVLYSPHRYQPFAPFSYHHHGHVHRLVLIMCSCNDVTLDVTLSCDTCTCTLLTMNARLDDDDETSAVPRRMIVLEPRDNPSYW